MTESKIIRFGSEYKYDFSKSQLDNWKNAKKQYAQKGIDIGDFPVMTEEEEAELAKQLENIK
jgi:hypothetical protein